MNTFALRVLMLPQLVLMLVSIGLMVAGAVLAARQDTTENRLHRAPYFAQIALIGLGAAAAQVVWLMTGPAVAGGWLWVPLLVVAAALIWAGYLLFPLARARARDAWGNTGMAFLTFIPIANLWLLFKPSQDENQPPHSFSGGLGVVVGLVALGLTGWLNSALPGAIERAAVRYQMANPVSEQEQINRAISTQGLEAVMADLVANTMTPMTVDEATILQRMDARGARLIYTYTTTMDLDALPDVITSRLKANNCPDMLLQQLIEAGAMIEHTYLRVDGSKIGTVTIDSAACGS